MPAVNDLTGLRFGRLTVIALDPVRSSDRQARWHCRCDCGALIVTKAGHLRSGGSTSCTPSGCAKDTTSNHPLYRRWLNMIGRCTKPEHPDYCNYGARGISVCERWTVFENFLSDMDQEFRPGMEIDREDNDGDYEPSNCKWKTPKQNCNNRRNTVFVNTPFGRMTQSEAAERAGIPRDIFEGRRRHGWSMERLFTNPTPARSKTQ